MRPLQRFDRRRLFGETGLDAAGNQLANWFHNQRIMSTLWRVAFRYTEETGGLLRVCNQESL